MRRLDPNNKIIKDFEQTQNCSVIFKKKKWDNIDELLDQLNTDFESKKYDYVIGFCEAIIKSTCATDNQKDRAEKLKKKAESAKINTGNFPPDDKTQ